MSKKPLHQDNKLLSFLEEHKEFLTTVRKWDDYALKANLPSSAFLINKYGSWNALKEKLGIPTSHKRYTQDELLEIAKKHYKYFKSKRDWDDYARKEGLPSTSTFIKVFGSWNGIKEILQLEPLERVGPKGYTKEELIEILAKHGDNFKDSIQWNEYAKENDLPTYKTIRKYLSYEEIATYVKPARNRPYNKDLLLTIGLNFYHEIQNFTMEEWNQFAKEQNLPSSHTFHRNFGSWKKAKECIAKVRLEKESTR